MKNEKIIILLYRFVSTLFLFILLILSGYSHIK